MQLRILVETGVHNTPKLLVGIVPSEPVGESGLRLSIRSNTIKLHLVPITMMPDKPSVNFGVGKGHTKQPCINLASKVIRLVTLVNSDCPQRDQHLIRALIQRTPQKPPQQGTSLLWTKSFHNLELAGNLLIEK